MRSDCTWSMSTVGLSAQEISFPIENPFLRGSYCHSMAGSKPSCRYGHEPIEGFYFSMESSHSSQNQQKGSPPSCEKLKHSTNHQQFPQKKSRPCPEPSLPSPVEDSRVVTAFQRLSVADCSPPQTPVRCSKPLPPIPPQTDVTRAEADNEVEFLTDESHRLLSDSDQSSKLSPFRYGQPSRRSVRNFRNGQINLAYYDGPLGPTKQHQTQKELASVETREHNKQQRREQPEPVVCPRPRDKAQRRLQRSLSGPAGSSHKPPFLRLNAQRRQTNGTDKAEVPPPIPPRMVRAEVIRRWSDLSRAETDEEKPPKLPPRGPLSRGSSRTPSPKSVPTYNNGVMPPTQSFAPDPKYVSDRTFHRQNSDGSPYILPIMKDGVQDSITHYYLLPQQSSTTCDFHTKSKVDFV